VKVNHYATLRAAALGELVDLRDAGGHFPHVDRAIALLVADAPLTAPICRIPPHRLLDVLRSAPSTPAVKVARLRPSEARARALGRLKVDP